MKAEDVIFEAAGRFDSTADAILARCKQAGLTLIVAGEVLRLNGDKEIIAAWKPMLIRHKPEIVAALTGQPYTSAANELLALAADYRELTACIIELCDIAGYSIGERDRILEARRNLTPAKYGIELAYFRLQVIRVKAGTYREQSATRRAA